MEGSSVGTLTLYDVLDELYASFTLADKNRDGNIDLEELSRVFFEQLGGRVVPETWAKDQLDANDVIRDSQLSFAEFCKMQAGGIFDKRLDPVRDEYEHLLEVNAGSITAEKLLEVYNQREREEVGVKRGTVNKIFENFDMLDSKVEVTFSLFFKLATGMPISALNRVEKLALQKSKMRYNEHQIRMAFAAKDPDTTGYVDKASFKELLEEFGIRLTKKEVKDMTKAKSGVHYVDFFQLVENAGLFVDEEAVLATDVPTNVAAEMTIDEIMSPKSITSNGAAKIVYTHSTPTDEATLDQMIEDGIYEMRNFTPVQLADWLLGHCGERFELFREAFLKHGITGDMFRNITEDHLEEMAPYTNIGDRLYMMNVRHKVTRAERIARRQHVVLQGRGFIKPPGVWASYVLTNESLKIAYVDAQKRRDAHNVMMVKSHISKRIDHIDLLNVQDCDIEMMKDTNLKREKVEVNDSRRKSAFMRRVSGRKEEFVTRTSEMNRCILHLKVEDRAEEITIVIPDQNSGNLLYSKMIDSIEEVQHMRTIQYV